MASVWLAVELALAVLLFLREVQRVPQGMYAFPLERHLAQRKLVLAIAAFGLGLWLVTAVFQSPLRMANP